MQTLKSSLNKKRQDAKDLVRIIEKLPEDKKREVLGIIKGYALCSENEKKK